MQMIITGSQFHQGGKWLARTIAKYHCLTVLSDDGKGLHTTRTSLKKKKPQPTNNNKKNKQKTNHTKTPPQNPEKNPTKTLYQAQINREASVLP